MGTIKTEFKHIIRIFGSCNESRLGTKRNFVIFIILFIFCLLSCSSLYGILFLACGLDRVAFRCLCLHKHHELLSFIGQSIAI